MVRVEDSSYWFDTSDFRIDLEMEFGIDLDF
jgi:hypothetical protein